MFFTSNELSYYFPETVFSREKGSMRFLGWLAKASY